MTARVCSDCPAAISTQSKGRCRSCGMRAVNSNSDYVGRRAEKLATVRADPQFKARHAAACAAGVRKRMADPVFAEQLREVGRAVGAKNLIHTRNPESRKRIRAALLAWCPERYWDLNHHLKRSGYGLVDRKRIIAGEVAVDERNRLASLTPMERMLERAARAGIVTKPDTRPIGPTMTLGGVASGAL